MFISNGSEAPDLLLDDRAADLWVPDLNLPIADMLPANYVQSDGVRLEIYARAARCRSEDELDDLERALRVREA